MEATEISVGSLKDYITEHCTLITWPSGLPDIQVTNPSFNPTTPDLITANVEIMKLTKFDLPLTILEKILGVSYNPKALIFIKQNAVVITITPSNFSIPIADQKLTIDDPKITITLTDKNGELAGSCEVQGTLPIDLSSFNGQTVRPEVSLFMSDKEAASGFVFNNLSTDLNLPVPSILTNLQLTGLGGSINLFFAPSEGYALGITANVKIKNDNSEYTGATIACQIDGDVPVPQYFSFYATKIQLNEVAKFFGIDDILSSISADNIPLTFTDPSFSWCKKQLILPDGSTAYTGTAVSSFVNLFGFDFYGYLKRNADKEAVAGEFQSDPITLGNGVFTLSGEGLGITPHEKAKNTVIPKTIQELNAMKAVDSQPMVGKGGPVLSFNFAPGVMPTLELNGSVKFLDVSDKVNASLGPNGYVFDLNFNSPFVTTSASFNMHDGQFTGTVDIEPKSSIVLPKELGTLTAANSKFYVALMASDTDFTGDVWVEYARCKIAIGKTQLHSNANSISGLVDTISQFVEDNVDKIFEAFVSNPELWIQGVASKVINTVGGDITWGLKVLKSLGVPDGKLIEFVGKLQKFFNSTAVDLSQGLKDVMGFTDKAVAKLLHQLGFDPNDIATALKKVFGDSKDAVAKAFKYAGIDIGGLIKALEGVYHLSPEEVAEALKASGVYTASDIVDDLNKFEGGFKDVISWVSRIF